MKIFNYLSKNSIHGRKKTKREKETKGKLILEIVLVN